MRPRLLKRLLQRDLAAMLPHAAPDIQFDFTASTTISTPTPALSDATHMAGSSVGCRLRPGAPGPPVLTTGSNLL
jgi:hypothetical protein